MRRQQPGMALNHFTRAVWKHEGGIDLFVEQFDDADDFDIANLPTSDVFDCHIYPLLALAAFADHVGAALRDHVCCSYGVSGNDVRHDRTVDHSYPRDSMDP